MVAHQAEQRAQALRRFANLVTGLPRSALERGDDGIDLGRGDASGRPSGAIRPHAVGRTLVGGIGGHDPRI
jgi:hypothetical protein